jgi:hypothetical protein
MKIIEYFLRYRPMAQWIKNSSGLPYLKLDIPVPCAEILDEWNKVKHLAVAHREKDALMNYNNKGWKSLVVYGASPQATEQDEGKETFTWTEIAVQCPKTVQWIKENFIIDSNTGRIRFMLLESKGYILPHEDRTEKYLSEINVAVSNPQGNIFRFLDHGTVPFNAGDVYMLDLSNKHLVSNNSEQDRLHIILHTTVDEKIIEKSYGDRYYN